ncbi:unnamed protein product [Gongylonema pulchrum]|uniref:Uncharacterized protein n=1 Tax=Gongylonema pulchrum TaxID=637853 RepID=A0A183D9A2_9BILA|nr:unnamed protein product [Gongylonema pulchrum]
MAARFASARRALPLPITQTMDPFALPMSGLLPSPIQPRRLTKRESEELVEPPRAGDMLRRVTEIAKQL